MRFTKLIFIGLWTLLTVLIQAQEEDWQQINMWSSTGGISLPITICTVDDWNQAYGWGDHGLIGYLIGDNIDTEAEFEGFLDDVSNVITTNDTEAITVPMLSQANCAQDEDFMTYEASTGQFAWNTLAEMIDDLSILWVASDLKVTGSSCFANISASGLVIENDGYIGMPIDTDLMQILYNMVKVNGAIWATGPACFGQITSKLTTDQVAYFSDGVSASAIWGTNGGIISEDTVAKFSAAGTGGFSWSTGGTRNSMTEGTPAMYLTSTGLGIFNCAPAHALDITGSGSVSNNWCVGGLGAYTGLLQANGNITTPQISAYSASAIPGSPNVYVYQGSPSADQILLQVATSGDASRFSVDEDGDLFQDGSFNFSGTGNIWAASSNDLNVYIGAQFSILDRGDSSVSDFVVDTDNTASGNVFVGIGPDTTPGYALNINSTDDSVTALIIQNTNAGDYDAQLMFGTVADMASAGWTMGVDNTDDDFKIQRLNALTATPDLSIDDGTGEINIWDNFLPAVTASYNLGGPSNYWATAYVSAVNISSATNTIQSTRAATESARTIATTTEYREYIAVAQNTTSVIWTSPDCGTNDQTFLVEVNIIGRNATNAQSSSYTMYGHFEEDAGLTLKDTDTVHAYDGMTMIAAPAFGVTGNTMTLSVSTKTDEAAKFDAVIKVTNMAAY